MAMKLLTQVIGARREVSKGSYPYSDYLDIEAKDDEDRLRD